MLVSEIMTREVRTVGADWSLEELKTFLLEHGISGAPVVDDKNKLVGVVSTTDLLRTEEGLEVRNDDRSDFFVSSLKRPLSKAELLTMHVETTSGQVVRDVMTPIVFSVPDDTDVLDVADLMVRGRVHRLVVTRSDSLCGIVSALDLVRALRDQIRA
ncbi:MAG: CBS domain-containing protein [Polyangiaceae bacterium]|nr:CBS domain-containing protein [Polyangiaceae bacterium]